MWGNISFPELYRQLTTVVWTYKQYKAKLSSVDYEKLRCYVCTERVYVCTPYEKLSCDCIIPPRRYLKLPNELKALLISDNSTEKASAALAVRIGKILAVFFLQSLNEDFHAYT